MGRTRRRLAFGPPTFTNTSPGSNVCELELEVTIRRGQKLTAMHEWDAIFADQQL
jgi:hypothetical protein